MPTIKIDTPQDGNKSKRIEELAELCEAKDQVIRKQEAEIERLNAILARCPDSQTRWLATQL